VLLGQAASLNSNAKPISLHASLHHTCTRLLVITTALLLERRARFAAGFATVNRVIEKSRNMIERNNKKWKAKSNKTTEENIESNICEKSGGEH
jgi:hypothetical protein